MGTTVKSFLQSFSEVPEGKYPPEYYTPRFLRAIVFGNYAHPIGIITHSLFMAIFALIVGAALLSVSVMNVLRSQSLPNTDFKDPEQVLGALNIAFPGEENNDMFFTIWYGVYKKSTRELIYASGGHPPALLLSDSATGDSKAIQLRTPNYVIGGMPEVIYEKKECLVGERNTLYIFSDGVYEVEKSDGSMWRYQEFADFINEVKIDNQSILDRLYVYRRNLGNLENFEDDFTIVEVVFG